MFDVPDGTSQIGTKRQTNGVQSRDQLFVVGCAIHDENQGLKGFRDVWKVAEVFFEVPTRFKPVQDY